MPEPDQELRLGRGRRAASGRRRRGRALDGGDVDVGGQVLPPDVAVRVVVDAVARGRPRSVPSRRRTGSYSSAAG